jgi:quinol monooxygenase YgiN
MSVLVTAAIEGNVEVFKQSLTDRAADYERISKEAQQVGAIHHRFGVLDDHTIMVQDEWASQQQFMDFFSAPELQQFITEVGGASDKEPEILIADAIESPDQF